MIDLDAYFTRIGYRGRPDPSLETLRALHTLHPAAIPFEAIDVLLDRGIDISAAAVDAKLIGARRGGYCFEQNGLFKRVLTKLGFKVEALLARVCWMLPEDAPPRPPTHMALRVTVDGEAWLVDVGFGGLVLTEPLRFAESGPQPTAHEPFRLVPCDGGFRQEAQIGGAWTPLYEISPEPRLEVDYEPPNWFTATHPQSIFRQTLMVARTTTAARYTLMNNRLGIHRPDGSSDRRMLDASELEHSLSEIFGLPVEPSWRPVLERAAAGEP